MTAAHVPRGDAKGFVKYMRQDVLSGFLVFLIALPLCLGIALACGYPPMAGIFAAIIGSTLTTFISDSEMTIKGPAAGLIVIAIGCIEDFGGDGFIGGFSTTDMAAYKAALAIGVAAAIFQILFGFLRAGVLGEFFPLSAVHGMLAAIGIIIIAKQVPVALGVEARGEPLELLAEIPHFIAGANPAIAAIGVTSLLLMFCWPFLRRRISWLSFMPAPLAVVLVSVPMAMAFDLLHPHSYAIGEQVYSVGEEYLVAMPDRVFGMFDEITYPDFAALAELKAWKWVFMFFIIGSLESILSAKAVDLIDPWKRRTSMDRDILAVGVANLCSAFVGGLPVISEIVRSRSNIDNGAHTRFADMWHGVFLLVCVALIPSVLHLIPMAALAAMLIYTGYRLAHPSEFAHVLHVGREQLVIFAATLVGVLATDLLVGIAIGIGVKMVIHILNGVPLRSLFKTYFEVDLEDDDTVVVRARESAVFSNFISFRRQLRDLGLAKRRNVVLDVSGAKLIDHSVMDKLPELQRDFEEAGVQLEVIGLDALIPLSRHERAARKRGPVMMQRVMIVAGAALEKQIEEKLGELGSMGLTMLACQGVTPARDNGMKGTREPRVRFDALMTRESSDRLADYLRSEIPPELGVTACMETVEKVRVDSDLAVERQACGLVSDADVRTVRPIGLRPG